MTTGILRKTLPYLRRLNLDASLPAKAAVEDFLQQMRELTLRNDFANGRRKCQFSLTRVPNLRTLQLFNCAASDDDLAKLDDLPSLEELELRGTSLTVTRLAGLGRFPRLRK